MGFRSTPKRGAISARQPKVSVFRRPASRNSRTEAEGADALFARAVALESQGRDDEAQAAYIDAVQRDGTHFDALIGLGNLLNRKGYRRAAQLVYREAAKARPRSPVPHVNLGNTFLDEGDAVTARPHFEEALALDPTLPEAHQGMSYVFARLGDEVAAAPHRRLGFRPRAVTVFPFRGEGAPVRTALLVSALGGNIGTGDILDDRTFGVTRIFADYYEQPQLPEADVIFNAIGDADRCEDALRCAQRLLGEATTPVVNSPAAVLATQRASVAARCAGISGTRVPKMLIFPRESLADTAGDLLKEHGFAFPIVLRALGFHTGRYLERIATVDELREAAARLPGKNLAAIEYLDTRNADGKFRKYRVMIVDGKLFPLHLAIADDWKVHYFSAGMADAPKHQDEERGFLEHMEAALGPKACAALKEIAGRLALDYGGVDFSLDDDGKVALFEANATMVIPSRETDDRLAYRRRYLQTVIEAVRAMILKRAARSA